MVKQTTEMRSGLAASSLSRQIERDLNHTRQYAQAIAVGLLSTLNEGQMKFLIHSKQCRSRSAHSAHVLARR